MRLRRKRWMCTCLSLLVLFLVLKLGSMVFKDLTGSEREDHLNAHTKDKQWLSDWKFSRTDDIPTVIVEEHFEVVKYWFQAADLDLIPRSKNVLLHIDAHIDGTIPFNVDSLPWFRLPHNEEEVHSMMQRKDMFIVAAAVTGFIDHLIWVWPTWGNPKHGGEEDWPHVIADVELGVAQTPSGDGQSVRRSLLCACWAVQKAGSSSRRQNDDWKCSVRNTTCLDGRKCPEISRSQCMIQSQVVVEVVGQSVARDVLAEQKWSVDKGFILDIDEDYFGIWSDAFSLHKAGIHQRNIDVVSELVSNFFCASSAEEEREGDSFYAAIISIVKELKSQSCAYQELRMKDTRCLHIVEINNFFIENEDAIMTYLKSKQYINVLCESDEKSSGLFFQSLLHFLLNFSIEQLDHLQQLGVCLEGSPGSQNARNDLRFHICHGDNIPNRTLVPFHLPQRHEISFQAVNLKQILSSVPKAPNIITIARSTRDGFTPKSFLHSIESKLMHSIEKSYRRVNASNVYYDSNLLGGRFGWQNRPQPWVSDILKYLKLR